MLELRHEVELLERAQLGTMHSMVATIRGVVGGLKVTIKIGVEASYP